MGGIGKDGGGVRAGGFQPFSPKEEKALFPQGDPRFFGKQQKKKTKNGGKGQNLEGLKKPARCSWEHFWVAEESQGRPRISGIRKDGEAPKKKESHDLTAREKEKITAGRCDWLLRV